LQIGYFVFRTYEIIQKGIKYIDFGFDFEADFSHSDDVYQIGFTLSSIYTSHTAQRPARRLLFVCGLSTVNTTTDGISVITA
jgi:hypothetical protein